MDNEQIKLKARLTAIEYMICNIYSWQCIERSGKNALADFEDMAKPLRADLRTFTVPGLDAALSDHIAATQEEAFDDLLKMTEALIRARLARGTASPS